MLHPELANHLATEKDKTSRTKHQRPKSATKDGPYAKQEICLKGI